MFSVSILIALNATQTAYLTCVPLSVTIIFIVFGGWGRAIGVVIGSGSILVFFLCIYVVLQ